MHLFLTYTGHVMRKIPGLILFFFLPGEFFSVAAQSVQSFFVKEKENLELTIQSMNVDTSLSLPVIRNFESRLNDISTGIERNRKLNANDKDKAKKSLYYF